MWLSGLLTQWLYPLCSSLWKSGRHCYHSHSHTHWSCHWCEACASVLFTLILWYDMVRLSLHCVPQFVCTIIHRSGRAQYIIVNTSQKQKWGRPGDKATIWCRLPWTYCILQVWMYCLKWGVSFDSESGTLKCSISALTLPTRLHWKLVLQLIICVNVYPISLH